MLLYFFRSTLTASDLFGSDCEDSQTVPPPLTDTYPVQNAEDQSSQKNKPQR